MLEGSDVRISGQDVGRGTFSHRHAMLVEQHSESVVVPLNSELGSDGKLELANSKLCRRLPDSFSDANMNSRFTERNGGHGRK